MDRYVIEWKIVNLSQWCLEVHGECIQSPLFYYPCSYMELYSKGISGQGKRLGVRFCEVNTFPFSGELAFYSSDGSLLREQLVNVEWNETVLELPPGPELKDVLSREGEDFITVRLVDMKDVISYEKRMCTTINVLNVSLTMNPGWIDKMETARYVCYVQLSPDDDSDRMWLKICSENDVVRLMIEPPTGYGYPFAVEMSVSLTGCDGTVDNCVENDEHVFRDGSPWTFLGSLKKSELIGKGISFFFRLRTKDLVKGPLYMNCTYSFVSIEPNNTICFSEKATSYKDTVPTKDSGSQTPDMPGDSVQVLSKELKFLYQDKDFSDLSLKCDSVSFPVHRNILSARSPHFTTMFSTEEAASSEVDIYDLDSSTLSRFLTHLNTGGELQVESALKLYHAADKYGVPSLKKECAHFLCAEMSISSVCGVLELADRHRDDHLASAAHDFIVNNFSDVLKSQKWESFMSREPMLAVKTVTYVASKKIELVCTMLNSTINALNDDNPRS